MFITIILALLFIAALTLTIKPITVKGSAIYDEDGRRTGYAQQQMRWIGGVIFGVFAVALVLSCLTVVQAKQVGVVTTFGKPAAETLRSGLHVVAPWQKVTEIDATIQTDEYRGDGCITVRLGDGNTACVSATIRWAVNETNANTVYADFRSSDPTEGLRDAVVSTQFKAAINALFAKFDPTAELESGSGTFTPDYDQFGDDAARVVGERTDGLVDIKSVTISYLRLDEKTQAKIDAYQAEVAKTRIAQQAQATAREQASANRILSESISNDPNVLVSRCLDLLSEGDFVPPAGFTCWPGSTGAVVVPATR